MRLALLVVVAAAAAVGAAPLAAEAPRQLADAAARDETAPRRLSGLVLSWASVRSVLSDALNYLFHDVVCYVNYDYYVEEVPPATEAVVEEPEAVEMPARRSLQDLSFLAQPMYLLHVFTRRFVDNGLVECDFTPTTAAPTTTTTTATTGLETCVVVCAGCANNDADECYDDPRDEFSCDFGDTNCGSYCVCELD